MHYYPILTFQQIGCIFYNEVIIENIVDLVLPPNIRDNYHNLIFQFSNIKTTWL